MPKIKTKYWVLLAIVFLVWLDWYIRAPDSRSRELTHAIESHGSQKLHDYPYKFFVIKTKGSTAYLSTPRNFDVPAFKALAVLYPEINTKDPNNPDFIAAEQLLGEVQSEAKVILLAQPGIREVVWELDRNWVSSHHIEMPIR